MVHILSHHSIYWFSVFSHKPIETELTKVIKNVFAPKSNEHISVCVITETHVQQGCQPPSSHILFFLSLCCLPRGFPPRIVSPLNFTMLTPWPPYPTTNSNIFRCLSLQGFTCHCLLELTYRLRSSFSVDTPEASQAQQIHMLLDNLPSSVLSSLSPILEVWYFCHSSMWNCSRPLCLFNSAAI